MIRKSSYLPPAAVLTLLLGLIVGCSASPPSTTARAEGRNTTPPSSSDGPTGIDSIQPTPVTPQNSSSASVTHILLGYDSTLGNKLVARDGERVTVRSTDATRPLSFIFDGSRSLLCAEENGRKTCQIDSVPSSYVGNLVQLFLAPESTGAYALPNKHSIENRMYLGRPSMCYAADVLGPIIYCVDQELGFLTYIKDGSREDTLKSMGAPNRTTFSPPPNFSTVVCDPGGKTC